MRDNACEAAACRSLQRPDLWSRSALRRGDRRRAAGTPRTGGRSDAAAGIAIELHDGARLSGAPMPLVSVVLPSHDERENIGPLLAAFREALGDGRG